MSALPSPERMRFATASRAQCTGARNVAGRAVMCAMLLVLALPSLPAEESFVSDQWALRQIGFVSLGDAASARSPPLAAESSIVVAVIDSGLDYAHTDLRPEHLWLNPNEMPNGRDDDGNGYVDDVIGWNFVGGDNDPADIIGHGTHVAGLIAATGGDAVRLMPLRIVGSGASGQSTRLAEAILYALARGARIINLSIGAPGISATERQVIDYAVGQGALVVVAAGNAATDTADFGPAGLGGVVTVAATDRDDARLGFSNWGQNVKIAAPGADIVSLRARGTDLNLAMQVDGYEAGSGFVGSDRAYYRATGTSFAAPFVSATAALILSRNPALTNVQVERMLLMSADDVETPGWDQYTGAGRLNVAKALQADPHWYLLAQVQQVQPVLEGRETVIEVRGTVAGTNLARYRLELGQGETPAAWKRIGREATEQVEDGLLGTIPIREVTSRGTWTIRVVAWDTDGTEREARGSLTVN